MMPIRANIVGPPSVATRIKASTAACHSAVCSHLSELKRLQSDDGKRTRDWHQFLLENLLAGKGALGVDHPHV
jgi:hypothetical protein